MSRNFAVVLRDVWCIKRRQAHSHASFTQVRVTGLTLIDDKAVLKSEARHLHGMHVLDRCSHDVSSGVHP